VPTELTFEAFNIF